MEFTADFRKIFFKRGNDVAVKNRNIFINFVDVFIDIIEKIVFDLVEFKPDNRIWLPLVDHISQLRLLDIKFIKPRSLVHYSGDYCQNKEKKGLIGT
jgi:hypothetical protein